MIKNKEFGLPNSPPAAAAVAISSLYAAVRSSGGFYAIRRIFLLHKIAVSIISETAIAYVRR